MPRINFQQQLAALKDKLLAMAALSQQALSLSLEAYLTGDMSLCQHASRFAHLWEERTGRVAIRPARPRRAAGMSSAVL